MKTFEKIETKKSIIYRENEILVIEFKRDAEVDLDDINDIITTRNGLLQGKKTLVLVDVRKIWQANKEAREKAASQEMLNPAIAMAILSNSLPTRLLANFYMKFVSNEIPMKMFRDKKLALEWLEKHKVLV